MMEQQIRSDDYCRQNVCRDAGGLFSFVVYLIVCFFLTRDVWSYRSWHQLEVGKKNNSRSQVNHFMSQLIHDYCKVLSYVQ